MGKLCVLFMNDSSELNNEIKQQRDLQMKILKAMELF